jgi:hypothetical protein
MTDKPTICAECKKVIPPTTPTIGGIGWRCFLPWTDYITGDTKKTSMCAIRNRSGNCPDFEAKEEGR